MFRNDLNCSAFKLRLKFSFCRFTGFTAEGSVAKILNTLDLRPIFLYIFGSLNCFSLRDLDFHTHRQTDRWTCLSYLLNFTTLHKTCSLNLEGVSHMKRAHITHTPRQPLLINSTLLLLLSMRGK